jgi:hypothetical protein
MRTIVVLLIAALVLTPTLAHATGGSGGGYGLVGVVALPLLVVLLLVELEKKYPNWRGAETSSPLPSPPSESQSSTVPAPADGSDR